MMTTVTFKPRISDKSEEIGQRQLKNKLSVNSSLNNWYFRILMDRMQTIWLLKLKKSNFSVKIYLPRRNKSNSKLSSPSQIFHPGWPRKGELRERLPLMRLLSTKIREVSLETNGTGFMKLALRRSMRWRLLEETLKMSFLKESLMNILS